MDKHATRTTLEGADVFLRVLFLLGDRLRIFEQQMRGLAGTLNDLTMRIHDQCDQMLPFQLRERLCDKDTGWGDVVLRNELLPNGVEQAGIHVHLSGRNTKVQFAKASGALELQQLEKDDVQGSERLKILKQLGWNFRVLLDSSGLTEEKQVSKKRKGTKTVWQKIQSLRKETGNRLIGAKRKKL